MSTITEVTSQEQFDAHVASLPPSTLLILSFHAPWAAPCAQMNDVLTALASAYPATTPPQTSWLRLNAEDLADISETYDVSAVPCLVLLRAGRVLATVAGGDAGRVRAAIEEHAKGGGGDAAVGEKGASVPDDAIGPMLSVQPKDMAPATPARDLSGYAPPSQEATQTAPEYSSSAMAAAAAAPASSGKEEDLHRRLSELVAAAPVMLFMKGTPSAPQCGFSRQLVALLRERGVRYGFFNVLADDEVRQGLKEFADWPTFPQLWVAGELVGGLDIVKEEVANDPDFFASYAVQPQGAGGPGISS